MKVAFATLYDARDIRRGSGTFYYMSREIERQGHEVRYVGPLTFEMPLISRGLRYLTRNLGKRYKTYLDPFVGKNTGRQVNEYLDGIDYDVLITNDYAIAGFSALDKPVVLYTDAMITRDYIERDLKDARLSNLSPITLMLSRWTIKKGLQSSNLCVFPAEWSANEAMKYHSDPTKIVVIPFGANVDDPGPQVAMKRDFESVFEKGTIDLLFIGKDWGRKGGDIAVKLVEELHHRTIQARLHIVGGQPSYEVDSAFVKIYGLLDKANDHDRNKLDNLFQSCDVFVLPSSSEGLVISVLEAAAYGMPALAYDTIGVRDAVVHGETGYLIKYGLSEKAFADVIEEWYRQPGVYNRYVAGARAHFEGNVNWSLSVSRLMNHIEELI
jgi:glycosyltransferase involved in cell wall biosynthesis